MAALAERAGGVIQRVNAFARKRELQLRQVDLGALLRRVVASAQEQHSAQASLHAPLAPVWVQADALLLEHLVHNLCGNALDWAQRGTARPQVQVRLRPNANVLVTLAVADSGPGVPEAERARIFDAFFSTKDGGMGMGLAICRSFVEVHQARLSAGVSPAGGARWGLHFQSASRTGQEPAVTPAAPSVSGGSGPGADQRKDPTDE